MNVFIFPSIFQMEFDTSKSVCFQDFIHILTKMKNRFTNPKIVLKMGKYFISTTHIGYLIDKFSKDQHFLCKSHLNSKYQYKYFPHYLKLEIFK